MFCPSQIKNYILTGLVSNFFYAPCNRVTFSLQKRNHHKYFYWKPNTSIFHLEYETIQFFRICIPLRNWINSYTIDVMPLHDRSSRINVFTINAFNTITNDKRRSFSYCQKLYIFVRLNNDSVSKKVKRVLLYLII